MSFVVTANILHNLNSPILFILVKDILTGRNYLLRYKNLIIQILSRGLLNINLKAVNSFLAVLTIGSTMTL